MQENADRKQSGLHESLEARTEVRLGSERAFGVVFAVVFAFIGLLPLLGSREPRYWALVIAGIFLGLAFLAPKSLAPLNRLWFRFGLLLHRVISPLIMGLLFFLVITPTGWIMRLLRKDILHLKFDPKAESYWIERQPPGPDGDSLKNQF